MLVVGASGFIGRALAHALDASGHEVKRGVRRRSEQPKELIADLSWAADQWVASLHGFDAVVNAAGLFRERGRQTFAAVHDEGPRALFRACERAGVRRVVQISALGADAGARSRFHLSKKSADDFLATLDLDWLIVQPSLVFGRDGESARQFALMASLPLVPLPGNGMQQVQPIHIDDLCALVGAALSSGAARTRVAAVGRQPVALRDWLAAMRHQMGLPPARYLRVPLPLVAVAIGKEALGMLLRGNTAPVDATVALLGRAPRGVENFIAEHEGETLGRKARLDWLLPLLRASVALTWIVTGIVSMAFYPVADSLAMLARVGLSGTAAVAALYGSALLDIALGAGIYAVRSARRWMWRAQLVLIGGYSVVIAFFLPEFWLHPFGPLLKNVPLMAAILLLHEMEPVK